MVGREKPEELADEYEGGVVEEMDDEGIEQRLESIARNYDLPDAEEATILGEAGRVYARMYGQDFESHGGDPMSISDALDILDGNDEEELPKAA